MFTQQLIRETAEALVKSQLQNFYNGSNEESDSSWCSSAANSLASGGTSTASTLISAAGTLASHLTTAGGAQPLIPILVPVYRYLNGFDLENLLQAFPFLRGALRDPRGPLPSFRCQDRPPLPSVKERYPISASHLVNQVPTEPRQPCNVPGYCLVLQKRCEGPGLAYRNHGEHFWVCVHCSRRAWQRYSLALNPVCYDLCLHCSRNYRTTRPIPAIDQFSCQ